MRPGLKHKRTLILAAIAAAAVILIIAGRSCSQEKEAGQAEIPLGVFLDNDMSGFIGIEKMDADISRFMQYWHLKGMSLTVMRNDSLLFAKGYGQADTLRPVKPGDIFRVASVSKLVTAAGIMKLQEQGKLKLSDKVFGESGILGDEPYNAVIKDPNYYKITVEHLLRHSGGFHAGASDPLFNTRTIMLQNHLDTPPDHEKLLEILLAKRLSFVPGTSQDYSNVGYMILSEIIEKLSGTSYEEYIRKNILEPAGCYGFRIARNYYKERYRNEVRYYLTKDDEPVEEFNGSGRMVDRCYGGNDITSLSGAGAWVASAPDLARFVASIDGRDGVGDVLTRQSVRQMTEYLDEKSYSLGWNSTDPAIGWIRTGTLSGTSALIKYYPDGECWIMVTNTSTWKGPRFSQYTSELFSKLRSRYSAKLPKQDLFEKEGDILSLLRFNPVKRKTAL